MMEMAELPKTKVFQKSRLGIEITIRKNPEARIAIAISIGDCLLHCCMPDGERRNVQASLFEFLYLAFLIFGSFKRPPSARKNISDFFSLLHNLTSILRQPLPFSPRTTFPDSDTSQYITLLVSICPPLSFNTFKLLSLGPKAPAQRLGVTNALPRRELALSMLLPVDGPPAARES